MKSCEYKCVLTGSKCFDIHHIYSFSNIFDELSKEIDLPTDKIFTEYTEAELELIKNKFLEIHNKYPLGVCVSKEIHILYHQLYGYNNTESQWYYFKKMYERGDFEQRLCEIA